MGSILSAGEPPAVDVREADGPFVIACEHASNRVPQSLGTLGLKPPHLDRHIAWDPGAADVAVGLSAHLGATLVMQRYSRLVVDCNREPGLPDAVAEFSEDTAIPGNVRLSDAERAQRVEEIWKPFHAALTDVMSKRLASGKPTVLATIHSFTPVYRGVARPWHLGVISTDDRSLAERILAFFQRDPGLVVGDNQPYSARDNVDYTIRRHGRERGVPHAMIEIRNDLIGAASDVQSWVRRLSTALLESAGAIGVSPARIEG